MMSVNSENKPTPPGDFLPDLCGVQAVFALVLIGELLALALVVVDRGVVSFDWSHFGTVSMMVQWVVLSSAGSLCPLRPWFRRLPSWLAGFIGYAIILLLTALVSLLGQWVLNMGGRVDLASLAQHLVVSGVFAGIALRYFYIQQQLHNQEQAELIARIQALQSRIRPHFLFNSMNSIASLIAISPVQAEKMVEDLSHLFRASLSEPTMVSLKSELVLCQRFAAIEQLRLGDRLKLEWQLPGEQILCDVVIPSFLLQPLVENAIYHGVQAIPEGGLVRLSVAVSAAVEIQVINPVVARQQAEAVPQGNGIALQNIRNRLCALYGQNALLRTEIKQGEFKVLVKYPKLYSE
ncbi:MAG: histidine kinase [Cellvibrionaceae bacterium]|nr:histidine kinase [Cellvibrionaceae bacterium]